MCNLYNATTNQQAIIDFARALRDVTGNLQPTIDIFPNYPAPVVRNAPDGVRELAMLTWGMPSPPEYVSGKADRGVTNIRNAKSPHWRRWLRPESRCVVAVTSFAEPSPTKDANGRTPNVWFALDQTRPLFFFAGVWARWHGVRRVKDGPQTFELYAFLTTAPNEVVAPIHPKAMPVILTEPEEVEIWLTAPAEEALKLQRPLADHVLKIVPEPPGFFDRNPKLA
jgi:putative SOS response-associated peptidase YedK